MALTRHEEGSLRELWTISFPLMLSSLSVMSMLFVDRLLLAHYSTAALNAAVNATTLGWSFVYGWLVLTSIAEVFVAQYNGAGEKQKIGEPVWQMIWLAIASFLFFIPLSIWGSHLFYGDSAERQLEREYFGLMMLFGPSFPLYSALCGFFVGQGKTKLITILAVAANIINGLLDVILIFGIDGWVPALGVKGAAIATSSSGIFQVFVLAWIFMNKENRSECGTGNCRFKWKPFWLCVRIGFPGAIFVAIELLGWAAFYTLMTMAGEKYILIAGVCQSVAILFYFFAEGISKAATTICGNLIGAKHHWSVPKVMLTGIRLHFIFFVLMLVLFAIFSEYVIEQFMWEATASQKIVYYDSMKTGLLCILFYMLFEGIRLLIAGILTAAGDTVFLLLAGSLSVWILLVAPVYYFIVLGDSPVEVASLFCVFYGFGACLVYLWRFLEGKWKTISITA